jgi:tRNA threonylcarbamoyladenosine biosynthesis protein TsaB
MPDSAFYATLKTMNVLAIDSSTEILSVALGCNAGPGGAAEVPAAQKIFSADIDAGSSHSELLFPVIDALLKTANIETQDIDLFLCMRGPGSWTGLRIGFSAVKGFALALGKPYISIPTLDCIALSAPQGDFSPLILPVLDAKAGRFFCALYEGVKKPSDAIPRRITEYLDAAPETIAELLPSGVDLWLTGNAANIVADSVFRHIAPGKIIIDANYRRGRAGDLLKYLAKNPTIVNEEKFLSSAPLYLRKSDAEINFGQK